MRAWKASISAPSGCRFGRSGGGRAPRRSPTSRRREPRRWESWCRSDYLGDGGPRAGDGWIPRRRSWAAGRLARRAGAAGWPGVAPRAAARSGEEYELLVALPRRFGAREARAFGAVTGLALTRIGACTAGRGVRMTDHGRRITAPPGFDHFPAR